MNNIDVLAARNCKRGEPAVAPQDESAPTRAHSGSANGVSIQPLPSFEKMYAFLRDQYLHSRFEGANQYWPKGVPEGGTYAELVTRGHLEYLNEHGFAWISIYESRLGRSIKYDAYLNILNPDEPPAQIQRKPGNLTHIYGA